MIRIINFKAYGDFLIALYFLKKIKSKYINFDIKIVCGSHIKALAQALDVEDDLIYVGDKWQDVPAIYNIKKNINFNILSSIFEIRNSLKNLPLSNIFLFDKMGLREKLSITAHKYIYLDNKINIYIDYINKLKSMDIDISDFIYKKNNLTNAIIIPNARDKAREIPLHVILEFINILEDKNINVKVLINKIDTHKYAVIKEELLISYEQSFKNLLSIVKKFDFCITADSMPSHLCEYLNIPVFVSTPAPKEYWLPLSCYKLNGWANFSSSNEITTWIDGMK